MCYFRSRNSSFLKILDEENGEQEKEDRKWMGEKKLRGIGEAIGRFHHVNEDLNPPFSHSGTRTRQLLTREEIRSADVNGLVVKSLARKGGYVISYCGDIESGCGGVGKERSTSVEVESETST